MGEDVTDAATDDFLNRLKVIAARVKVQTNGEYIKSEEVEVLSNSKFLIKPKRELLIIGCSTGGPSALQALLPRFPKELPVPIIVLQHMPPGFTGPLAERFDTICNLHVKEIENGDMLEIGNIYIAPAGFKHFWRRIKKIELCLRLKMNHL